ncbi:MAG: hypothetical protein RIK87_22335 [Fuerstiella sp.]
MPEIADQMSHPETRVTARYLTALGSRMVFLDCGVAHAMVGSAGKAPKL